MIPVERNPNAIRVAGIGGQGSIKMGLMLAQALTYDKKWVVHTQHYGAQVRGGPAYSDVLFCKDPIDYPVANLFNIICIMHQKLMDQNSQLLKPNGVLICDSTFVNKIPITIRRVTRKIISVPISEIASERFSNLMVANVICLGLLAKITGIVNIESVKKTVADEVPEKYLDLNLSALEHGATLSEKNYYIKEERNHIRLNFE
jgi:2-oxoglutarate ferredoxin oxidoreductase subunit gamma